MKKRIIILFILFIILIPLNADAETIAQKRKEISDLKSKYQAQQDKKAQAKNQVKTDEQSIKNKAFWQGICL